MNNSLLVTQSLDSLAVIDSSIIAEINSEHALAQQASKTAVEHGSRVGALLLQVKESLPHGAFGLWLAENVAVSDRQAQRYIRNAKGLPVLRTIAKTDTVSYLNHDPESFAKIVANAVAEQMAIERAKMVVEFEREKELAELAKGINADYESFKQNRDGLINDLIKLKALHVGAYWTQLVELHKDESKAAVLFGDYSRESMDALECDEKSAVVLTDCIHASLVGVIDCMKFMRDRKGYAALGYESLDDYVKNEHPDTDLEHLERYQKMPIYSEIVTSIKAFNEHAAQ
jgi:hypothetical protein